jgi:hypothetical protein
MFFGTKLPHQAAGFCWMTAPPPPNPPHFWGKSLAAFGANPPHQAARKPQYFAGQRRSFLGNFPAVSGRIRPIKPQRNHSILPGNGIDLEGEQ